MLISFEHEFENGLVAEFVFEMSSYSESVPYGSTYASFDTGECECVHIWVDGKDLNEEDLKPLIAPQKLDWGQIETWAWENFEDARR